MSDIAVRVENVSKRYRIGMKNEMHDSFVGAMVDFVKRPLTNLKRLRKLSSFDQHSDDCDDIIWALRDVSFEVKRGEVVGIIGSNGSGKSTLLKIISRVTEPTKGRGETNGRVGSLLEVGTGFHPELTGRENIYLNGAVLGMKKVEIAHKFDAIVDFSGVEKFIDTPIKRYSSGMYVRLAFAVAAHFEPDILLVDEVLAVGDAAFQKKCLGKMDEVGRAGRTVLLVSHNMASITSLCHRALLLGEGCIERFGETKSVVDYYLQGKRDKATVPLSERADRDGDGKIRYTGIILQNAEGKSVDGFSSGDQFNVVLDFTSSLAKPISDVGFAFSFRTMDDHALIVLNSRYLPKDLGPVPQRGRICCQIPKLPLYPGKYSLTIALHVGGELSDLVSNAIEFDVYPGDFYGSGKLKTATSARFMVDHEWYFV